MVSVPVRDDFERTLTKGVDSYCDNKIFRKNKLRLTQRKNNDVQTRPVAQDGVSVNADHTSRLVTQVV